MLRFNERIQVNREDISDEDLLAVALEVREAAEQMDEQPTAFRAYHGGGAAALCAGRLHSGGAEVGLGGRLDSTKVVVPEVCAITSIALDQRTCLATPSPKIAHEKAGIIKAGIPVVSYRQKPEAEAVIMQRAREVGAPVSVPLGRIHAHAEGPHQVFSYDGFTDVRLKLAGTYQPNNAVMAIEIARVLRGRGFEISDEAIKAGLEATVWQGRFEVVRDNPTVIVDGGHNEQRRQCAGGEPA